MLAVAAHNVTASVQSLAWILGTACPLAVALLTKSTAPSWLKAVLNAALATLAGLLAVAIKADGHLDAVAWLLAIGNSMIFAFGVYAGFWRHVVAPQVANATAKFGIGPAAPPVPQGGVV